MSKLQAEKRRRASAAENLQAALRALGRLNAALDDGDVVAAKEEAAELSRCLLAVEDRVGVLTPATLFDTL